MRGERSPTRLDIARRAKAPEPDKCSPYSRAGQVERTRRAAKRLAASKRVERALLEALGPADDLEGYL